mgnify:CR=1 FL=1
MVALEVVGRAGRATAATGGGAMAGEETEAQEEAVRAGQETGAGARAVRAREAQAVAVTED